MRRFILGIFLLAAIANIDAAAQKRLTILHVNDTHSHLEPERSGEHEGMGGVIERAAYRDSVVKADGKRNVLLLHAGDFDQGTSYFSVLGGDIEIDLINAMKYDCVLWATMSSTTVWMSSRADLPRSSVLWSAPTMISRKCLCLSMSSRTPF